MPSCAVKLCRNSSILTKKSDGITFHLFPKGRGVDKWVTAIRQSRNDPQWQPSKKTVVCSDHFYDSDMYMTKHGLRRVIKGRYPKKNLFASPKIVIDNDDTRFPATSFASSRTCEPVAVLPSTEVKVEIGALKEENDPLCSTASEFVPVENSPSISKMNNNQETKLDTPRVQRIFVKLETQQQNLQVNIEQLRNSNVANKETALVMSHTPSTAAVNIPAPVPTFYDDESLSDVDKTSEEDESIFDTPRKHRLRNKIKRQQRYLQKYKKQIKTLQQTVRRYKKRNEKLRSKLKNLKNNKKKIKDKDKSASVTWQVFSHQQQNK